MEVSCNHQWFHKALVWFAREPSGWFNTPTSECPISTSVQPSKSKGIGGQLQKTGPVRWEEEESSPPFTPKGCVVVHMLWRNANQFRHCKIKERSTMTCRVSGNISCCTSMCGSWIKNKKYTYISLILGKEKRDDSQVCCKCTSVLNNPFAKARKKAAQLNCEKWFLSGCSWFHKVKI